MAQFYISNPIPKEANIQDDACPDTSISDCMAVMYLDDAN